MSTLANTTWEFGTLGQLTGIIYFQQVGPSQNAGVATITATNPPIGYEGSGVWTAQWAEVSDGNNIAVQFNNFINDPNFNPPPLGIPTINGGGGSPQLITLFGTHTNGQATMFGTNYQTQDANGEVVMSFTMTRQ